MEPSRVEAVSQAGRRRRPSSKNHNQTSKNVEWRRSDAASRSAPSKLKREEFVSRMGQTWWRGSDATLQGDVPEELKREEFVSRMGQTWRRGSDAVTLGVPAEL